VKPSKLEFPQKETRHDRFPGPCVVSQKEAHARKFQKVFVHCLKLMRQRVNAGN